MGSNVTHINVQWCTVPPKCGTWPINQCIHTLLILNVHLQICAYTCITSQCPKIKMLNSAGLWIRFIKTLT